MTDRGMDEFRLAQQRRLAAIAKQEVGDGGFVRFTVDSSGINVATRYTVVYYTVASVFGLCYAIFMHDLRFFVFLQSITCIIAFMLA